MFIWDDEQCDYVDMDQTGMGAGSTYANVAVPNPASKVTDSDILPGMKSNRRRKKKPTQAQGPLEAIEGNPSGGATSTS